MIVTDVAWVRNHQQRLVLELRLDGQLAHIPSAQKVELTRRGLVKGVDLLASDWRRHPTDHPFIEGKIEPGVAEIDLMGCTDDPQVFALYTELCQAIAADTWRQGPAAVPITDSANDADRVGVQSKAPSMEANHGS